MDPDYILQLTMGQIIEVELFDPLESSSSSGATSADVDSTADFVEDTTTLLQLKADLQSIHRWLDRSEDLLLTRPCVFSGPQKMPKRAVAHQRNHQDVGGNNEPPPSRPRAEFSPAPAAMALCLHDLLPGPAGRFTAIDVEEIFSGLSRWQQQEQQLTPLPWMLPISWHFNTTLAFQSTARWDWSYGIPDHYNFYTDGARQRAGSRLIWGVQLSYFVSWRHSSTMWMHGLLSCHPLLLQSKRKSVP